MGERWLCAMHGEDGDGCGGSLLRPMFHIVDGELELLQFIDGRYLYPALSVDAVAAVLRAAGWTVTPPGDDDAR